MRVFEAPVYSEGMGDTSAFLGAGHF